MHLSFLFLWQERILPLSLMPSKHKRTILDGSCLWMIIFSKNLWVCSWGGVYQWRNCVHLITKTTQSTTFLKHFLQRPKTGQCDAWQRRPHQNSWFWNVQREHWWWQQGEHFLWDPRLHRSRGQCGTHQHCWHGFAALVAPRAALINLLFAH